MKTILAIDDQVDNLITIKAVIKNNIPDCRILLAQSGQEGIELAEKEQPDTVLLDIIMPGMDGYEVCKHLKSNEATQHIPVIMVTAIKTDALSRAKGLNTGADAFLSKPIEAVELSAQVNVMLRIKKAEDKLRAEKERLEVLVEERTRELKESEKKYKTLYYDAPLPYHSLNEDGIFKDVNLAWLNLLEYTRQEVIGKWFGDFLHPDFIQTFQNKFTKFKDNGSVHNVFFKIRHKKGHYLDILLEGRIGYNIEGGFKQTFCVFQDITIRKKIEQALKQSEERFRKAFQTSPDSVNINRVEDGFYISVNKGFTRITGYSEEDVAGKTSLEIDIWVDLNDRKRIVEQLKKEGKVENFEAKFRTKSGEIIDGLMSAAVIELDGVPHHINITRNITEKKRAERELLESERKLNTLLNNLQGIAYRCKLDKDWTMEFVSDGFEHLTGFSSKDVLWNKKFSFNELIFDEDREIVNSKIHLAVEKHRGFEIKYRIKTATDEIRHVLEKGVGIYDRITGKVIALEGFISDITNQVIAEQALKESEEKYRFLAKNSVDCIWTLDKNLKFTYLSPALETITGYRPEEWLGTKLYTHFTKNEFAKASTFTSKAIREYQKFSSIYFESKILNKNKQEISVEFSASLMLDENDNLVGFQGTLRDITERIRAREALIESERKFKDLANLLPQIIYESDLEGNLTYINELGLKTFGYDENDFNDGINILESIAPEDRDRANEILPNIPIQNMGGNPEYLALRKNGEQFPILIYSNIIFEKNKPYGMRGVIVDISQRKEWEKTLKESEEKLRLIFNNSPVGISITDLEGKFIDVNPALSKITGYSRSEMLNRHFNDFSHADDVDLNANKFNKLVNGKISFFDLEKRYIHKNGNIVYVFIRSQLIHDHMGNPMFQTAMVEDITEKKRADQIQKVLYQISNAVVNSANLESLIQLIRKELGIIIDTTNFFVALYDEKTETISLPFFTDEKDNHTHIPHGKSLTKYVINTQKSLLANIEVKNKLVAEGKLEQMGSMSKVWLGVPLKTEGKITGVLAVQSYNDENAFNEADMKMLEFVSEQISIAIQRVKAEEELKEALEKANESDRLKSSFLATMSHELRTPLNAIIGFSEFFDTTLPPEDVLNFGQIINSSGNHLLSIVNDLFDITLIESGETKIRKEYVKLKSILTDVFNVIDNINNKESKDIIIEYVEPINREEVLVHTDANKLKQILINLLKNAYKFTDKGYIHYGYELIQEEDKSFIRFFVEDSGIGISSDKQDVIFDIFRQVEDTSTRRYGGAGIGLSVAKKLTELLGGKIWLESEEKKGSTFYFTIPYEKSDDTIHEAQSELNSMDSVKAGRVLVVEDDESSYYYLKTVLEKTGVNIVRAANGKEAVDICMSDSNIKMVLMDINLPIMNGYEATKIIKSHLPQMPIIAQTAYAVSGDKEKALKAGCDDYLSKPIQINYLIEKMEKYLNYLS
ncbi:PAS domain S-box protein [Maribellus comscasis]|uniref:histidine kinase n=1 Tax=Maribellus comscasis TaxID=2681766 RepID=A0A6I6JMF1_9BACT|nr:PAS domain S-box protein [Maribellus comscasis]QGY44096.1 PAS domain S-box protein [Maribellus comscasis]